MDPLPAGSHYIVFSVVKEQAGCRIQIITFQKNPVYPGIRFETFFFPGKNSSMKGFDKMKSVFCLFIKPFGIVGKKINPVSFLTEPTNQIFRIVSRKNTLAKTFVYKTNLLFKLGCVCNKGVTPGFRSVSTPVSFNPGGTLKDGLVDPDFCFLVKIILIQTVMSILVHQHISQIKNDCITCIYRYLHFVLLFV